jgi:hypothetical protein
MCSVLRNIKSAKKNREPTVYSCTEHICNIQAVKIFLTFSFDSTSYLPPWRRVMISLTDTK